MSKQNTCNGMPMIEGPLSACQMPARKPLTDEEMRDAFLADPDPIFKLYKVSAGLSCAELDEILKRVARAIERAHGIGSD